MGGKFAAWCEKVRMVDLLSSISDGAGSFENIRGRDYCVCEKCNPKINCASYDKETYKVRNQSALTTMEVVDWVGLDGIGIG